jgi:hypothetical protein
MSLKQTIKRILKEEKTNVKQFLFDLVGKIGIEKTAKQTGLSVSKIVEISGIEINHFIAKQLILEYFKDGKLTKKFEEFTIKLNEDEVFIWSSESVPHTIDYDGNIFLEVEATPYYEWLRSTPVELDWFGISDKQSGTIISEFSGDGDFFKLLANPKKFNTTQDVIEWFELTYLYKVYNIIMGVFLPPAMAKIEDELDNN